MTRLRFKLMTLLLSHYWAGHSIEQHHPKIVIIVAIPVLDVQDDHRCHDLQFRPEDLSGPESHTGGHSPARKAAHALHSPTMQGKAH